MTTTPDSATAAIFGAGITVLCCHHQSIDRLGTGLTPTAFADDGVIEAVELPGPRSSSGCSGIPRRAPTPDPLPRWWSGPGPSRHANGGSITREVPGTVVSSPMPKSGARKVVKPVAATVGILGTMASIWWFALKPRRKAKSKDA